MGALDELANAQICAKQHNLNVIWLDKAAITRPFSDKMYKNNHISNILSTNTSDLKVNRALACGK